MAKRRLSRLQRFILALAWENCREGIEREGSGTLFFNTLEIYSTYYGDWSATDEGWEAKPHEHSVSISRSLKKLEGLILNKERHFEHFSLVTFKPEPEIIGLCRGCWNEGGLKLIGRSNIKNAKCRAAVHEKIQELQGGGVGGNRKGAKSGKAGVLRKMLNPKLSPFFCSRDAA